MFTLEYIWLDQSGLIHNRLKSNWSQDHFKNVTLPIELVNLDIAAKTQVSEWYLDDLNETLIPVKIYPTYLIESVIPNYLVLCELKETLVSPRIGAIKLSEKTKKHDAWFSLQQNYQLSGNKSQISNLVRQLHTLALLSSIRLESSYHENDLVRFQIGPHSLIRVADDLIMTRYLVSRLANINDLEIRCSNTLINVSTNATRNQSGNGLLAITQITNRIDYNTRIPMDIYSKGAGYFQIYGLDSTLNPYLIMTQILDSIVQINTQRDTQINKKIKTTIHNNDSLCHLH